MDDIVGSFRRGRLSCFYSVAVRGHVPGVVEVTSAVWPLIRWHEHIDEYRHDFTDARDTLSLFLENVTGLLPGCSDRIPETPNDALRARLLAPADLPVTLYAARLKEMLAPGVLDDYQWAPLSRQAGALRYSSPLSGVRRHHG